MSGMESLKNQKFNSRCIRFKYLTNMTNLRLHVNLTRYKISLRISQILDSIQVRK